ncbi:EMYY motif lipoprotein, partial [[Eubacterium] rectale]|nr:EMYY motif lipoprotein [Agathobacter rectalis]
MEKDIDKKLMPAFKSYKKAAKQLPAETKKVKQLRHTYLHEVDQQEKALKDIRSFVHLCNQSIKANEDILNYTRLF